MVNGEGIINIAITGATIIGIAGYLIHTKLAGDREFKKDVYDKLEEKREKSECDEFRRLAERMEDKEDRR